MTLYKNNEFSEETKKTIKSDVAYKKVLGLDYTWEDFEDSVARCMKGIRKKSNTGLTDIYNEITAWSAKTRQVRHPFTEKKVKIVSGRIDICTINNLESIKKLTPEEIAKYVLDEWNRRVNQAKLKYNDIRTIILLKSKSLDSITLYEEETSMFKVEDYDWKMTKRGVLHGIDKITKETKLTWYSSGKHFEIISTPPNDKVTFEIDVKRHDYVKMRDMILSIVGFSYDQTKELKQDELNLV